MVQYLQTIEHSVDLEIVFCFTESAAKNHRTISNLKEFAFRLGSL
jgi:hypothetical protein